MLPWKPECTISCLEQNSHSTEGCTDPLIVSQTVYFYCYVDVASVMVSTNEVLFIFMSINGNQPSAKSSTLKVLALIIIVQLTAEQYVWQLF